MPWPVPVQFLALTSYTLEMTVLYTSLFGVRRPTKGDHPAKYVPTLVSVTFHAEASSRQNVAICIV